MLRQGSALGLSAWGQRCHHVLSLSWPGSVLGPFPSPCMAPSGSRSVPPQHGTGTPGAESQIEQSRLVKSKCSLASGQGEGTSGSSGDTCRLLQSVDRRVKGGSARWNRTESRHSLFPYGL